MLKVEGLTKYYGNILGIKDVNFEVNEGEIFGFIGPNGAGKSTAIRLILDILKPDEGSITIDGENNYHNYDLKLDVGYLPGEVNLYSEMKVRDVLEYNKTFYKEDISNRTNYLVDKLKLDISKVVEELSFGNLKKLGIVLALAHSPKLLVLDEPTSGLDPIMQEVFFELLNEEKEKGTTVFFSSHILSEVKKICDRIAVIKDGSIIKIEDMDKVGQDKLNIIILVSREYKKLNLPINDIVILDKGDDFIKFMYKNNINNLLKIIGEIKVDNLLIEEPAIEDVFMHYYK